MTYQPTDIAGTCNSLAKLPVWVTSARAETVQSVAFLSGAVLSALEALVADPGQGVPARLLGNRLALTAATVTSKLEGRLAREADIRDAYHLTPPGEARGPDGDLLAFWRAAAQINPGEWDAQAALIDTGFEGDVESTLSGALERSLTHGPLAGCAFAMQAVLETDPRAERVACLLADLVLARSLGWKRLLPISAQQLTKTMLRDLVVDGQSHEQGQGAELAVQQSILASAGKTIRLARDLATSAAALQAIAPKLRAKTSDAAVRLFLSEDAIAPSGMLSPYICGTTVPMTSRAARRFCDRLVELGVARELTGRSTFRLYGL